ncbi:MAG: M1 family metallopeptidase [Chloroflexia bacterium]|nr:M1 family metallopeptidase [Chloroflexia bacterium]
MLINHPGARGLRPAFLLLLSLLPVVVPLCQGLSPAPIESAPGWPEVPPVASYKISVTLDPESHKLQGHETIIYHNRSADSLSYLVLHLYLNAFRSSDTVFMREAGAAHRGYGYDPHQPGWIQVTALQLEDQAVDLKPGTTINETLMTATLPQPLLPGEVLTLTLDFEARLPRVFARSGFAGDFYMVGQWFPKLAVYRDGRGWNSHAYHANSEFFADFGDYNVAITVPQGYVVGATGLPAGREQHADGSRYSFQAQGVIDFAWTAWPHFLQAGRQVGPTEVQLFYDPAHRAYVQRYLDAAEQALLHYGRWYGPYPYPRLTLVDVPDNASAAGGMEYPTLVTVQPYLMGIPDRLENRFLELVTMHEIAHQWWQSTVATNEFEEPWLDEGLAEYSGIRLLDELYGPGALLQLGSWSFDALDLERLQYLLLDPRQPMAGRAWDFNLAQYGVAAYYKPALTWSTMEGVLGEERWLQVLQCYYQRYQFRHPTAAHLLAVIEEIAGSETRASLEPLIYGQGLVDYAAGDLLCQEEEGLYRCEATVERLGQVALPVEIEMTFADGRRVQQVWDGQEEELHTVYREASPLVAVEVDPQRKLYLDVSFQNNSVTRPVQAGPLLRISSQWFYWLQQFVLFMGGLW